MIDLASMSLDELEQHQSEVAAAIFMYKERKKAVVLEAIEEVARAAGFSLEELFGEAKQRDGRSKVAAKYANPADASQTWTGRGRKPKWVVELLASGKSLDDAAI